MERLKRLTPADKNRILLLFVATLVALYFGLRYPQLNAEIAHEANMVSRKLNRLEVRKQDAPKPVASKRSLEQELEGLEQEMAVLDDRLAGLRLGFARLDSTEELQRLWLDVSALAQESRLDVEQMQGYGSGARSGAPASGVGSLEHEANNRYQRPLVTLKAKGGFAQLMGFLRGLQRLSFNVSVVRLGINAGPPVARQDGDKRPAQPLSIDLVLAM